MKEIKNKKIFIVVVLVMVLGVIGVTYAVSSTTDILDNLFNTQGYNVSVLETFESPDDWVPGATADKIVKAKNDGGIVVAVRMSYTEEWKDRNGTTLSLTDSNDNTVSIIEFDSNLNTNWIKSTENGVDYYYYYKSLSKNNETSAFIKSVTYNPNTASSLSTDCVDNNSTNVKTCTMAADGYAGGTYKLTVNVETAEISHYKEVWNTDVDVFIDNRETLTDHINSLASSSYIDNTDPDMNVRYIGYDPNNYVQFNNELWRIIGVFDGRVKLYRRYSLGNYSWDKSLSNVNYGYGVNEWSQAKLMQELNGDYLDTTLTSDTLWYGNDSSPSITFYHSNVLTEQSQNLIDDAVWYLGSINNNRGTLDGGYTRTVTPVIAYRRERSNYFGKTCDPTGGNCNDQVVRQATWTGKVGLAYVSDYVMSTSLRPSCMDLGVGDIYNCAQNSWMKDSSAQWFIGPLGDNTYAYGVSSQVSSYGYVGLSNAYYQSAVHPVVYLKASVHIDSGTGTHSDPYIISE